MQKKNFAKEVPFFLDISCRVCFLYLPFTALRASSVSHHSMIPRCNIKSRKTFLIFEFSSFYLTIWNDEKIFFCNEKNFKILPLFYVCWVSYPHPSFFYMVVFDHDSQKAHRIIDKKRKEKIWRKNKITGRKRP